MEPRRALHSTNLWGIDGATLVSTFKGLPEEGVLTAIEAVTLSPRKSKVKKLLKESIPHQHASFKEDVRQWFGKNGPCLQLTNPLVEFKLFLIPEVGCSANLHYHGIIWCNTAPLARILTDALLKYFRKTWGRTRLKTVIKDDAWYRYITKDVDKTPLVGLYISTEKD